LCDVKYLGRTVQQPQCALGVGQSYQRQAIRESHRLWRQHTNDGLFLPGSSFYSNTTTPKYDPSGAKKLVAKVEKEIGKPITFALNVINDPQIQRGAQYLKQQYADIGVTANIVIATQNADIGDAVTGKFQATMWRQFGSRRPGPELRLVEYDYHCSSNCPELRAELRPQDSNSTHRWATRNQPSRPHPGVSAGQRIFAQDLPYIFWIVRRWALVANPHVQNFAKPRDSSRSEGVRI